MSIPADLELSALFLAHPDKDDWTDGLLGTGFLVGRPESEDAEVDLWVVTARHCLRSTSAPDLILRSTEDSTLRIATADWILHDRPEADVAVAKIKREDLADATAKWVPYDHFPGESVPEDLVYTGRTIAAAGLFYDSPGCKTVRPIVRRGYIARMNDELHAAKIGGESFEFDTFIVDMVSTSGFSGSPVFLVTNSDSGSGFLPCVVGLVSGHWESPDVGPSGTNTGLTLVTPSSRIRELIGG